MTAFSYKAISKDGVPVTGVVEAYDEFEAVAKIKEDCPIVTNIEPVPQKRERIDLNEPLWVSEKVLTMVCSQFAILLRAGLPVVRVVELIAEQTDDRLMKRYLRQVAEDVAAGYSLAQSFETRGKKIPMAFIESVRAGEESGTLEHSFAKLEKYYNKSYKTKAKVRSALMYPAFLCVLAAVVIAIVMVVTVPVLLGTFETMGGQMPLPTRMLMAMANGVKNRWWLILAVVTAVAIGLTVYSKTEAGRKVFARVALKLPVLGKISLMKAASQFANTMTTLLAAGLPMTRALTITGRVMDNYVMGLSVGGATVGIEEGKRLGDVLRQDPYLPPLLVEMASVGEESGSLEDTLDTIGAYYDNEVEAASNKALSMLEPAITIVMGLVIGFIVIAIYWPTFTMYNGMGG